MYMYMLCTSLKFSPTCIIYVRTMCIHVYVHYIHSLTATISLSCRQLYTVPPIRSGILCVEEAAKQFVELEEQEREREERERKHREKMSTNDVGVGGFL